MARFLAMALLLLARFVSNLNNFHRLAAKKIDMNFRDDGRERGIVTDATKWPSGNANANGGRSTRKKCQQNGRE